jgi:hypothetical protein
MWEKDNDGKIRFKTKRPKNRYDLFETFCIPPKNEADFKYKLVNVSGILATAIFSLPFVVLSFFHLSTISRVTIMTFPISGIIWIFTIFPNYREKRKRLKKIENNPPLMHAYFLANQVNSFLLLEGELEKMPDEYLEIPPQADINHPFVVIQRYYRSIKFFCQERYEDALNEIYSVDVTRLKSPFIAQIFKRKFFLLGACLNRQDEARQMLFASVHSETTQTCIRAIFQSHDPEYFPYQILERFLNGDLETARRLSQSLAEQLEKVPIYERSYVEKHLSILQGIMQN